MLKTVRLNKQRKQARKQGNGLREKRLMNSVKTELYDKLRILEETDSVEIEVADNVASIFADVVMNDVGLLYDYMQVDNTHYVFSNKEVDL